MDAAVNAWILTDNAGYSFAVAEVEMVEYLVAPPVLDVHFTPDYCSAVMPWRGRLLAVVNYGQLFEFSAPRLWNHIGVLAYQLRPGEPLRHVAVALGGAPYRIVVTDEESDQLPELYAEPVYRPLVRSVLRHDDTSIPILDVNYLTSAALRDSLVGKAVSSAGTQ